MSRYIDADAFIEENDGAENSGWTIKELVNNFPTADVRENVRGEWLEAVSVDKTIKRYRCSRCNYHVLLNRENYCPNCGAVMRKEVKE